MDLHSHFLTCPTLLRKIQSKHDGATNLEHNDTVEMIAVPFNIRSVVNVSYELLGNMKLCALLEGFL